MIKVLNQSSNFILLELTISSISLMRVEEIKQFNIFIVYTGPKKNNNQSVLWNITLINYYCLVDMILQYLFIDLSLVLSSQAK